MKKLLLATVLLTTPAFSQELRPLSSNPNFFPTEMKCPAENGGMFEMVSWDKSGSGTRVQILIKQEKPALLIFSTSTDNGFKEFFRIDPAKRMSPNEEKAFYGIVQKHKPERDVCSAGSEDQKKFRAEMAANRKALNR